MFLFKTNYFPEKESYSHLVIDKCGIEVGGPSQTFISILPIYKNLRSLDSLFYTENKNIYNCSTEKFLYSNNKFSGQKFYIKDFNDSIIPSEKYDFILSSNIFEYSGNSFQYISKWLRFLKQDGFVIFAFPFHNYVKDHSNSICMKKFLPYYQDYLSILSNNNLFEIIHNFKLSGSDFSSISSPFNNEYLVSLHTKFNYNFLALLLSNFGLIVFRMDIFEGNFFAVAFKQS